MKFKEWFNGMQNRYCCRYEGYEQLLEDAFNAGRTDALEEAEELVEAELMNTNMLTSFPPKSSAAWNIAAAIRRLKNASS